MRDYYLDTVRLQRWDKKALIKCIRTLGGHRRIHTSEIQRIIEDQKGRYSKKISGVATNERVSSHDQKKKGDLDLHVRTYNCGHNTSKNLKDYLIFENTKKVTGKWVVPLNNKTV